MVEIHLGAKDSLLFRSLKHHLELSPDFWAHDKFLHIAYVSCRQLAVIAAIDKELQSRQALQADSAERAKLALTEDELVVQRREAVAQELPASLEVMRIQSFLVEAEVRCQRMLHLISSMPLGFDR